MTRPAASPASLDFPRRTPLGNWSCLALCLVAAGAARGERPNIVWLVSEDNSQHYLRLYGDELGPAPAIEALAADGVTFQHAFSCAPVCSVARTTLMSGVLAPRAGFQFHRKYRPAALPDGGELFPAYLRRAGYYCTNNAKTDYNVRTVMRDIWDESSRNATWRKRPSPDTPFFHMQSFAVSHESSLHFSREEMLREATETRPEDVRPPAYLPDTPTVRYTLARYHDRMRAVDQAVAQVVAALQEDGLWDNTFVFYFGDHGGVLPRSKGYLFETGLHVPLVVRVPEKFRDLCPWTNGSRAMGFVNFSDFAPTVLALAGLPAPAFMDGRAFLGRGAEREEIDSRDEAFGYADRFDEKYDFCRSLRVGDWKYIRYYEAHYPHALQNNYRYNMLAYQEWRTLFQRGELNTAQREFFLPKPVEALYRLSDDPEEVRNLATDPRHADKLLQLRERLREKVVDLPDLSFFPESFLIDEALPDGAEFGRRNLDRIAGLATTADLALEPWSEARGNVLKALQDADPWRRYWAIVVCSGHGEAARDAAPAVRELLEDKEPLVVARAAEFLGAIGEIDPRPPLKRVLGSLDSEAAATQVLNMAVYLSDGPRRYPFELKAEDVAAQGDGVTRRLQYLSGESASRRRGRER